MLFVLFQLGKDRYALEATQVVEILPLLNLKQIPQALPGVAGVLNYHGSPIPVIDLCQSALGRPASLRVSTRIILLNYSTGPSSSDEDHLLGLIVEQATGTFRRENADFIQSGISVDGAPYLGPVVTDSFGITQRVEIRKLLPESIRDVLFRHCVEPSD